MLVVHRREFLFYLLLPLLLSDQLLNRIYLYQNYCILKYGNLDNNLSHFCPGFYQFGDRIYGCWVTEGHGEVNLSSAIIESCDVYFYKTIKFYDFDKLAGFFKRFGFGKNTGVDIQGESKGVVPTTEYMNDRYGRLGWSKGALLNYCIGQGEILVTPMQVFNYTNLLATKGTSKLLNEKDITTQKVNKVKEGSPHIVDLLTKNKIDLVINTTKSQSSIKDSYSIRRTSLMYNIPYYTTIAGAKVAVDAIEYMEKNDFKIKSLQRLN